jgi:rod shape determining protein RodA
MRTTTSLKSMDWILTGSAVLLVGISLAMLFSSTQTTDLASSRFVRQAFAGGVAVTVAILIIRTPYHELRRYAPALYGLGLLLLVSLLFVARIIRGTASRLELGGFQFQPSEFMKIALILLLAWYFSRQQTMGWRASFISAMLALIPVALIVLEPDLGGGVVLAAIWSLMLIFSGAPWHVIGLYAALGVAAFIPSWVWLLAPYQKERLLVFLDPTQDPLGAGYNVMQSQVALGSGYLWGRGLGHGPQSQLQFLPERHTDFILASLGEELGWLGVMVVLILYGIMLWRILKIARATRDPFGQLIAVGVAVLLSISLLVSAGMNMGLLPVTGLPLPLLSYGGSNLLGTFILLALVQSVHVHSTWLRLPPTEISHVAY